MKPLRTLRTEVIGKDLLRAVLMHDGSVHGLFRPAKGPSQRVAGGGLEAVWEKLLALACRADPTWIGPQAARARFLAQFPQGFADPLWAGRENGYKRAARARLLAEAPLEAAAAGEADPAVALRAFGATNLLSPFETMRAADLLKGPDARAFLAGAARFAEGGIAEGLAAMRAAAAPHDAAKWTILTCLPFLWRPDAHLFLKPKVTKDAARRLGHPFAHVYAPGGGPEVYASLLDLGRALAAAMTGHPPSDNIDVQGLIWVLGKYPEPEGRAA